MKATATKVRLDGLGDQTGKVVLVAATFGVDLDVKGGKIKRLTELTFADEHGKWVVTAYRVGVERATSARTTSAVAHAGNRSCVMKARRRSDSPDAVTRRTGDGGLEVAAAEGAFNRKPRTAKQRIKRALLASGALVVVVALGIVSLGAAWLAGYKVPLASGATYLRVEKLPSTSKADAAAGPTDPFFILLIGNDDRPGVGGARGDALHLVGVNPKLHKATMLDIPRDTCWAGDKINAANATGGAPAQAEAVGGLIGVHVSYAVDVNFDGFTSLVDGVGGFEINVPFEMHDSYSGAYFHPGVQHMNGDRRCASRATATTSRRATSSARTTRDS